MSGYYLEGKEALLARTIPAEAGIYVVGVNTDYEYDETHTAETDLSEFILLPEKALESLNYTNGTLRAANPKWVAAGADPEEGINLNLQGLILYFKLGESASLFAFLDRAVIGLPQTLTGFDITAFFHADGILKL